jgi:hypothetical protein
MGVHKVDGVVVRHGTRLPTAVLGVDRGIEYGALNLRIKGSERRSVENDALFGSVTPRS